jgi:hypothetical protein
MSNAADQAGGRLDRLIELTLQGLEEDAANGMPPSVAELNGVRRLLAERRDERELERLRQLTREED